MFVLSAIAHFLAACLLVAVANWINLMPWRKSANAHWTERARQLFPARVNAAMNVVFIPVFLYVLHLALFGGPYPFWILDGVAGFLGTLLGSYPFSREIYPGLDFRTWRYYVIAGWGVRICVFGSLGLACALMPENFGWETVVITIVYLSLHLAIQRGLLLRYLRWVEYLKPAGERLQQIVNATSSRMNVPVRATWQLGGLTANAFAFTMTGELAFSDRLLTVCNDEEVTAICAHELAHLKEPKSVLAGRILGSLALFPLIYMIPAIHSVEGLGYIFPIAAMFSISTFARQLSQKMEKQADSTALKEQSNPGVYASALEKIYRENQMPAVNSSKRQTHPHLYDRLLAAGITPDYPRPAKPKSFTIAGVICLVALGLVVFMAIVRHS